MHSIPVEDSHSSGQSFQRTCRTTPVSQIHEVVGASAKRTPKVKRNSNDKDSNILIVLVINIILIIAIIVLVIVITAIIC